MVVLIQAAPRGAAWSASHVPRESTLLARGLVVFDFVGLEIRGVFLQIFTAAGRRAIFRAEWCLAFVARLVVFRTLSSRHPFLLVL
jgi:hypothetical protein